MRLAVFYHMTDFPVGRPIIESQINTIVESGIIDPAKVTRNALQNAASIAGLLLTTESLIVDKPISGEKVLISDGMM